MNVLKAYFKVFFKASPYSLYVLLILFLAFMLDQLDRYALPITSIESAQELQYGEQSCLSFKNVTREFSKLCATYTDRDLCNAVLSNKTDARVCEYNYNGQGIEYQMVSGPVFNIVFTSTGVLISIFADNFRNRRVLILSVCLVFWSLTTMLTGFVNHFWQLAVFRFGLGIGQAGCNPIATSIIADYFDFELRGSALSMYYWGIYTGYSLSYVIGETIKSSLDWRWVYRICGIPGFLLAVVLILTVKSKPQEMEAKAGGEKEIKSSAIETLKFKYTLLEFLKPSLIFLCIAGSIRMAAGDIWAYNNNTYFKFLGQSQSEISSHLGVIPMVFGVFGSFLGGFLSDRVAKKADPSQRIWVLVFSQISAAPFVVGVLFLEPPYCYYSMIPTYIIGEMWIGVCLSVVVELVPERLRITGIGVYFFIITNIGGNMQVLVPIVQNFFHNNFDLTTVQAFRGALYVFFPGEYILGSLLFLVTLLVIKRDLRNVKNKKLNVDGSDGPLREEEV